MPQNEGSVEPLEALLLPLLPAAYGVALRLTRNGADAEDLVQEAAFLAARGFGGFAQGTNFRAWFFRILTNAFYSKYRRDRREGTPVELEEVPSLILFSESRDAGLLAESEDPAAALLDRLDGESIERAITSLPDEYRVVCTLYFMQDLSYQEIADMAGVPIGTVRSRLHRGRRLLQRALWTIAVEHGLVAPGGPAGEEPADERA